ncbi:alpha/beta fold hydrolase [Aromatoleum petrolei]|uniref:Alpha/beta fold hydrolase n=1 Tax=Aromatoleum petrolei TaxID=76116 RepID=A0ABX1MV09_9RHOO|nr:alpha/beta hydrolase [Aromatoleum petrolei]NMF91593.1 alpha/beta fold hydrolase [Aromatoleum petrolei]QTQ37046.1 Alpha/beta hydrolase fold-1 domain-containing protein [Aromatoleum petrolei]
MKHFDPLVRNNVHICGNADADRTIVFVHGFGTEQSVWRGVVPHFARDWRVVLLDNVGAGASLPEAFVQSRYLGLQGYADDLLEVCDALQLKDAVLVGHSVGAMAAVLAANRKPEDFAKLVLICASPRYLNTEDYHGGFTADDLNQIYSAIEEQFDEWAAAFAPMAMGNSDRPQLARYFSDQIRSIPPDRVLTVLCSTFQSDHRQDVCRIAQPTLLLQSQDDVAVPAAVAHYLQQHIPDSRLVMLKAGGHLPHFAAPDEVADAIRGFI